jgi:hypothetical protein
MQIVNNKVTPSQLTQWYRAFTEHVFKMNPAATGTKRPLPHTQKYGISHPYQQF